MTQAGRRGLVAVGLCLLVAGTFGQAASFDFVDYDDGEYVYRNPPVLAGLTSQGVAWAFTTTHAANWHPLTWLSHMLDVELFGVRPGPHHLVSVAIHAANAVLLFLVLEALTGALPPSALAAALFAVHPLHVESVAWISERKDVLSALFFILGVAAYGAYARRPGPARYGLVAVCLVLALLAKPMAVTFPFVLLLLDFWPLARIRRPGWGRVLIEKVPLLGLVALSAAATLLAQRSGEAVAPVEQFPLADRLANALVSYLVYLRQAVWPAGLAVFYPHPSTLHEHVSAAHAAIAAVVLAAVSLGVLAQAGRRPHLAVGWLWYLGTLVPVIGLVQVGAQAHADRYTYLPLVGLLVAAAWALWAGLEGSRPLFLAISAALVAPLAVATSRQAGVWHDRDRLYAHALAVTEKNWLAWNNLGVTRLERGEVDAALEALGHAAQIKPDFADAWYNAGVALQRQGRHARAAAAFQESLRLHPDDADAWVNLGISHRATGALAEAVRCQRRALELRPNDPAAVHELSLLHTAVAEGAEIPASSR